MAGERQMVEDVTRQKFLNFILGAAVAVPLIRGFEERSVVFPMLLLAAVVAMMYMRGGNRGCPASANYLNIAETLAGGKS